MTTRAFPLTLDTDEALEAWTLDADGGSYLVFSEGTAWIAYQTEDGDWFATRPAWDDDRRPDGTFPDGVTHTFEGLALPLTIAASAEMPAAPPRPVESPLAEANRIVATLDPGALFALRGKINALIRDGEHPRLEERTGKDGEVIFFHPGLGLEFSPERLVVVDTAERWTRLESADMDERAIDVQCDDDDFTLLTYAVEHQGTQHPVRLPEGWCETTI